MLDDTYLIHSKISMSKVWHFDDDVMLQGRDVIIVTSPCDVIILKDIN